MPTVYDTPSAWVTTTSYVINDIVTNGGYTYYCLESHVSGTFATDLAANKWDGVATDSQNRTLARFFWGLSYRSAVRVVPKVNLTKFGDGYEQRSQDGINNSLIAVDVSIEGMDDKLALAVGQFLYTKKGATAFYWTPFPPFNTQKRFVCRDWSITPVFYNNASLQATFEEVAL